MNYNDHIKRNFLLSNYTQGTNNCGRFKFMSMVEYAKKELDLIGMTEDSPAEINTMMREHILHMVEEFSKEGHSGFSAGYALSCLEKLLRFEPLSPLTGEEDEWNEIENGRFQNRRCSHVFKDKDGAYDIDGIVWRDPDGSCYTNYHSRVYVDFPYVPKTEYQDSWRDLSKKELS